MNHDQVSMLTYTCYVTRAAVIKLASALVLTSGGNLVTPVFDLVPLAFQLSLMVYMCLDSSEQGWLLDV